MSIPQILLVLAFLPQAWAGVAVSNTGWAPGSTITALVEDANAQDLACIRRVAREISSFANIRFELITPGQPRIIPPQASIKVRRPQPGDATAGDSHVGNRFLHRERMNLILADLSGRRDAQDHCDLQTIRHEFGHLLGLQHEHSHPRVPRPVSRKVIFQYPRINPDFLRPIEDSSELLVTRYDPDSVMHYSYDIDWTLALQLIKSGDLTGEKMGRIGADWKWSAVGDDPQGKLVLCLRRQTSYNWCTDFYVFERSRARDTSAGYKIRNVDFSPGDTSILRKLYPL